MTRAASGLLAALILPGCGYVGPPLPPALDIPSRVTDLRAVERGENIEVAFTLPPLTTEGLALKSVRSVELQVAVTGGPSSLEPVPAAGPGPLGRVIPAREWVGKDVVLTVRATGPRGKVSDCSAPVALHVETPLARPADLKAANAEQAVRLTWQGAGAKYRIFRAEGDQQPQQIGESDRAEYLDAPIEYGKPYRYYVQAIAGESRQSDASEPAPITPKDEFPPAVPVGLAADPGVNTIELSWQRNTESDFQGYNVYRAVEGGAPEKVASLITAPAYSDRQVEAGKKYRYTVSAVDLTGLESERSAPAEVTAQ